MMFKLLKPFKCIMPIKTEKHNRIRTKKYVIHPKCNKKEKVYPYKL